MLGANHRDAAAAEWNRVESELRALLGALGSAVVLLDEKGRIRSANLPFAELMGIDPGRLTRGTLLQSLRDLRPRHSRTQSEIPAPGTFAERWLQFSRAGPARVSEEIELTQPSRRVLHRAAGPVLDSEGHRIGWLEIYGDITDQRLIQSRLVQTEKMAALGQLVSGIAHELNNPLTTIRGYAEMLLGRGLEGEQAAETRKIYQEAERAGRIVRDLLLFARGTQPERTPVDLNEIVERTLALRSYELKMENIELEMSLDPHLPHPLADAHQLQQVILNLVVNAEQAILQARPDSPESSAPGHIRILTQTAPDDRLILEVSDDGPDIAPEIASRIFDPFFTTKPAGVGTGLGLSIVYGIVQAHGGDVYLEKRRGTGPTFVVELPIVPRGRSLASSKHWPVPNTRPALQVPAQSFLRAEQPRMPHTGPGQRILVVEDEPTVAQLIADVLREEGHSVDAVLGSEQGLERLLHSSGDAPAAPYDLVICDLMMPRLDGPAFYRALARAGHPAQHRIIFITGDTLAPRTLEFLEKHHLPCLAKPFLVEELKQIVNLAWQTPQTQPNAEAPGLATVSLTKQVSRELQLADSDVLGAGDFARGSALRKR